MLKKKLFLASAAFISLACVSTEANSEARQLARLTPVNTPTQFYFQTYRRQCIGVAPWNLAKPATVVFPEHPAHGSLEARSGEAPVVKCQNRPGFATVVTYTPEHNYAGADDFQIRVLYQLLGRTVSRQLNVHVEVSGHGAAR